MDITVIINTDVLSNGIIYYDENKQFARPFNKEDLYALDILKKFVKIVFITDDDHYSYKILNKFKLDNLKDFELKTIFLEDRMNYFKKLKEQDEKIVYIGFSFMDKPLLEIADLSCVTKTSSFFIKDVADFSSPYDGISDCVFYILYRYFGKTLNELLKFYSTKD